MKLFCPVHRAQFFEMNPEAPDNLFMLGLDNPERIAVLETATWPMGFCQACYDLALAREA